MEFNGLPATSNGFILDGFDTNDPWLGLNIGLSTNLVIGLDAIQQATVNTNSFAVDQGRYAASQVNFFTKSGTNALHGDAYEVWNGSLLNAQNYFLHANDTPGNAAKKPRSVVNEFGVSLSGPIRKDKLFIFGHYEGLRIALPIVTAATVPTPTYQAYVLQQLAVGGVDPANGTRLPAQPAEIPFYRHLFSLYSNVAGSPVSINGCPFDGPGVPGVAVPISGRYRSTTPTGKTLSFSRSITQSTRTTASGIAFNKTQVSRPLIRIPSTPSSTLTRHSRSAPWWSAIRIFSRQIW